MNPARSIGTVGRIATGGVVAVMLAAAGAGIGLAIADGSDHQDDMGTSPMAATGKPGKANPARVAWAHQYGQDRARMPNLADVRSASPEQRAAATDLLARTEAATAKYNDVATAEAAGFDIHDSLSRAEAKRPKLAAALDAVDSGKMPKRMPMRHVANKANRADGNVLDPDAPETLMYEYTGHGAWKLVGVMYTANESFPSPPPDPGGPITRWHYHAAHGGGSLMMHIFFVPSGDLAQAYALEMDRT